ncbi:uncharacterized protein [Clytia hemisphaerica]|uniref:uncharacterized protein n=1 Tax=Clytia hemisphaerica TaxID=252671 RepID=UPI0034D612CE
MTMTYFNMKNYGDDPVPNDIKETQDEEKKFNWLYGHVENIIKKYVVTYQADQSALNPKSTNRRIFRCHKKDCKFLYTHKKARNKHEKQVHGYTRKRKDKLSTKRMDCDVLNKTDHKLAYQKALFTMNMLLKNIHDCIREGDGERLLESYKFALLYLKHYNHTKYSFGLLKLFTEIEYHPDRALGLIWGRFVNTKGYAGHNISMDLHLEHLNGYLKEGFRALRSNLNQSNADRVAKTLNNVKDLIQNTEKSLKAQAPRKSHTVPSFYEDVKKLAEELVKADSMKEIPDRNHASFQNFNENVIYGLDYDGMNDWVKAYKKKYAKLINS